MNLHRNYELMKLRHNLVIFSLLSVGGYGLAVYSWLTRGPDPDPASRAIGGFSLLGAIFCTAIVFVCIREIKRLSTRR
jgi:hypothetical protein